MTDGVHCFTLPRGGEFSIPHEWWTEAEMDDFRPQSQAYLITIYPSVLLVPINQVAPQLMDQRQHLGHGGFDRNRMVDILRGIATGSVIPPVPVVERQQGPYRYRLANGTHRYYASVAAGFSHLPTVPGWLPETE
jgi:hypothetical protein